jgi:hypothetical protein
MTKEILDFFKGKPVEYIFLIIGILLFIGAFSSYDEGIKFPTKNPIILILCLGIFFIGVFFIIKLLPFFYKKSALFKATTNFGQLEVLLKFQKIQDADVSKKEDLFILPVNTTFIDDCINHKDSALGSFFANHHSDKISSFTEDIRKTLDKKGINSESEENYKTATALILPSKFSLPSKLMLVASTIRKPKSGIHSTPTIISNCIENIFHETSNKRVKNIHMPIIGSGHGGLDLNDALLTILVSIKFYARKFHHIKQVNIYILEKDKNKINSSLISI